MRMESLKRFEETEKESPLKESARRSLKSLPPKTERILPIDGPNSKYDEKVSDPSRYPTAVTDRDGTSVPIHSQTARPKS